MVLEVPLLALQKLQQNHPRLSRLAFFLCGALLMLSFAPLGWYLLSFLLLQPFLFACLAFAPRVAAGHGFCYGAGLFLAGTYWLYISIHVLGQAPLWVAIVLMLGLVMVMGLYYALTAWLSCRFSPGRAGSLLIVAPTVWVAVEWLRGWFLSGFPWMTLGYAQIDSPLAGFAPVLGVYGLSFLVLLISALLLHALMPNYHKRWLALGLALLTFIAGAGLARVEWTEASGQAVLTTIVQGGVPQDRKWLREQFVPTLNIYRDALLAHPDSDIVVWPEVAIPATLDQVEPFVTRLSDDLRGTRQTLLFGILERDFDAQKTYNSIVKLDDAGRQLYRKRHLVPFGETFPVPGFVRDWMRLMSLPHSDMSPGDPRQPLLQTVGGEKLAVAICYEDAYGAEQLYALPDATILINVSNDAWFGDSIAPHQHLEIARMRALEVGRSVVRATNTGISGFIGPRGELLDTMPQFTEASGTLPVVPRRGMTPYARFGNWSLIVPCILLIAVFFWRDRKSTRA